MKCLVTGGAGFIGTNLVERLRKDGHEVRVADLLYGHDLTIPDVARESVRGMEAVFHLAADSSVSASLTNHTKDLAGPAMMMNLLSAMKEEGIRKMVFTSSAAVYGDALSLPITEDAPLVPISLYGVSKVSSENLARVFTDLAPVRVSTVRFGNPVGEGGKKGVVWEFVKQLKDHPQELTTLGDGKQIKAFTYVGDAIEGLVQALSWDAKPYDAFNIASYYSLTLDEAAEVIIEAMGLSDVKITHKGGRRGWPGDVVNSALSIRKARDLGYEPTMTPPQAIRHAVRWMLDNS